jgi:hypothetical protein
MMRWWWYFCPAAARGERAQRAPTNADFASATKDPRARPRKRPAPSSDADLTVGWGFRCGSSVHFADLFPFGPATWHLTFYVFRRPGSRPSGRRRAFHRLSQAFTFTARGGKARSAAAENVC